MIVLVIFTVLLACIGAALFTCAAPSLALPGPKRLPFVGSILTFLKNWDNLIDFILENTLANGSATWGMTGPYVGFAATRLIFLTKPSMVQHLLKDSFDKFEKGKEFHLILTDFLGDGIFVSDGAKWRFHRKVASHMFTRNLLKAGTDIAIRLGRVLVAHLRAAAGENKAVDLQDLFFCLTMDVFSEIAFGVELNSIQSGTKHPFAVAFDSVQELSSQRMKHLFWKWEKFLALNVAGSLCPREVQIKKDVEVMRAFSEGVITQKRRDAESGGKLGRDLISRFIEKKESALNKVASSKGSGGGGGRGEQKVVDKLQNKELQDIVLNFMIAGRDTTACLLSWTFFELLRHPAVVERVRAEAAEVFGPAGDCAGGGARARQDDTEDGEYDYDKVMKLQYLHALVSEVLRLHPSVPRELKFCREADTFPDGTTVKPGDALIFSPYAMNRDPTIWEDPLKLDPERWLDEEGKFKEANMYKYNVFNAGPRLCLGKPLAYLEVKLITLMLVRSFDFKEPGPKHDGSYLTTITMPMKGGFTVTPTAL